MVLLLGDDGGSGSSPAGEHASNGISLLLGVTMTTALLEGAVFEYMKLGCCCRHMTPRPKRSMASNVALHFLHHHSGDGGLTSIL